MMNYLELQFGLRGKTLPADHGYSLYSALKQTALNGESLPPEVLLCSVPGVGDRNGTIFLTRSSRLRLRCPAEQVQHWYRSLQNVVLDVRGHLVRLVQPRMSLPQPSPSLRSRLVTFKLKEWNTQEVPIHFLTSCQQALQALEIEGDIYIDSNRDGNLAQRALQVHHRNILGFGVCVEGLNEDDSLKLQCCGLGGRKHFGCGWFYPVKTSKSEELE